MSRPDLARATEFRAATVLPVVQQVWDESVPEVSWLGSGQWSDCFAFHCKGEDLVVRVGKVVEDFYKDKLASEVSRPNMPVPAVMAIGALAPDHYFAISQRVFGDPLERCTDWDQTIGPTADLLDALQAVDTSPFTGWGRWDATGRAPMDSWTAFLLHVNQDPVESRVHGWKNNLERWPGLLADFRAGYDRLRVVATDDIPRSLVHNDLVNRNAFIRDGTITGVFDWGNSLLGDHLYDLALFSFWRPWYPHMRDDALIDRLRHRWEIDGRPVAEFTRRLNVCLLHIGLEHIAYNAFLDDAPQAHAVAARLRTVVP